MISLLSARNNDVTSRGMFSGTFAYVSRQCDAGRHDTVKMHSPGNLGVFEVATAGFTADKWPRQNFAGKTAHVGLHAIGGAVQAAVWVPIGIAGTLLSASLFACGFKGAAKAVVDHSTLACTFVLATLDIAIDVAAAVLLAAWVRSLIIRR